MHFEDYITQINQNFNEKKILDNNIHEKKDELKQISEVSFNGDEKNIKIKAKDTPPNHISENFFELNLNKVLISYLFQFK